MKKNPTGTSSIACYPNFIEDMKSWTFDLASRVLQVLRPLADINGLGLGMCGSVLHFGESLGDLDLIVFPLKTDHTHSWENFYAELQHTGFDSWQDRTPMHKGDHKRVLSCNYAGHRIDWFLFHLDP